MESKDTAAESPTAALVTDVAALRATMLTNEDLHKAFKAFERPMYALFTILATAVYLIGRYVH